MPDVKPLVVANPFDGPSTLRDADYLLATTPEFGDNSSRASTTKFVQIELDWRIVPTFLETNQIWRLPENKQMVFSLPIELEEGAILDLEGYLIQV